MQKWHQRSLGVIQPVGTEEEMEVGALTSPTCTDVTNTVEEECKPNT